MRRPSMTANHETTCLSSWAMNWRRLIASLRSCRLRARLEVIRNSGELRSSTLASYGTRSNKRSFALPKTTSQPTATFAGRRTQHGAKGSRSTPSGLFNPRSGRISRLGLDGCSLSKRCQRTQPSRATRAIIGRRMATRESPATAAPGATRQHGSSQAAKNQLF